MYESCAASLNPALKRRAFQGSRPRMQRRTRTRSAGSKYIATRPTPPLKFKPTQVRLQPTLSHAIHAPHCRWNNNYNKSIAMVPARRGPLHRTANCCRTTGVASHKPEFASPPIQRSRQRIGSESSSCTSRTTGTMCTLVQISDQNSASVRHDCTSERCEHACNTSTTFRTTFPARLRHTPSRPSRQLHKHHPLRCHHLCYHQSCRLATIPSTFNCGKNASPPSSLMPHHHRLR